MRNSQKIPIPANNRTKKVGLSPKGKCDPRPTLSALFSVHRAETRPNEYRMGYESGTTEACAGCVRNSPEIFFC